MTRPFPGSWVGKNLWEWRGVWTAAPAITGLILILRLAGWLQPLEWLALDGCFQLRPLEATDPRIVIVGINEQDLKALGQWPLSDATLAQLLQAIRRQQPRGIGLDLYRSLPVEPGHAALLQVFATTPNLVGIQKVVADELSEAIEPPPLLKQQGQVGTNDVLIDSDGKLRRGLLFVRSPAGETLPSFALLLALNYLQAEQVTPDPEAVHLTLGTTTFVPFETNDGGYVGADAGGYQMLVNFRGPGGSFPSVTLMQVLQQRIPADLFRDRIVLIGTTAESLKDYFDTPFSSSFGSSATFTSGVEVQANLVSQILSAVLDGRPLIQTWPDPWEGLWILAWSSLGAALSWQVRSPQGLTLSLGLGGLGLLLICGLSFQAGWWLPLVPPFLGFVGAASLGIGYVAHRERQDRQMIMHLFGRHVTPQIAAAIWRDRHLLLQEGRLPGRKMVATVLFTDLKDFCTIAEQMDPETLMLWLNEYMAAMSQLVSDYGGIVDKFMGDAIMAVFGVPLARTAAAEIAWEAQQAVRCAFAMVKKLQQLNQQWQQRGYPSSTMRAGLATGPVVTGSLGGLQRLDYTAIGDSVNIAARLESYDKTLDGGICRILISAETYRQVQEVCVARLIGTVQLKGREQSIEVYQVFAIK